MSIQHIHIPFSFSPCILLKNKMKSLFIFCHWSQKKKTSTNLIYITRIKRILINIEKPHTNVSFCLINNEKCTKKQRVKWNVKKVDWIHFTYIHFVYLTVFHKKRKNKRKTHVTLFLWSEISMANCVSVGHKLFFVWNTILYKFKFASFTELRLRIKQKK